MPSVIEDVLARGDSDLVSMARPFLADPEFMQKAFEDKEQSIKEYVAEVKRHKGDKYI